MEQMNEKKQKKSQWAGKKYQIINAETGVVCVEGIVNDQGRIETLAPDLRKWRLMVDGVEFNRNY